MALTAAEVYRLSATELRVQCAEEGLNSQGPVRSLRGRLVRHLRGKAMASKHEETDGGNVSVDEVSDPPHHVAGDSHGVGCDSPISVLTELLRQVPALTSEDPEAILGLICKLDEYHARAGLGQGQVTGTCKCGNEPSSSIKCGELLD